ncbi:RIB43A-like with coiled-coils protein 2 [Uloborus diversus]|uniref:RIB43A-like with coiled-coils protein 2 n=1 Tax=Uloborus diversus TaxID=327109 RepID=UPI00240A3CAA|nr:RIB43A-like with coiled-coils protein 2 [Uloborus diversus]
MILDFEMALNLPVDEKLAASINRRRISEEQRKQRIFNAKVRQIGIDVDALKYQMHDKALSRAREADRENKIAEELKRIAYIAEEREQQEKEQKQKTSKKIDQFRLYEQKPEHRRDFDLYDPDQLKKEQPPRISDNAPCPISGLQRLEGEDLNYRDRMKRQQGQMRDLLLQQMQEKRMQNYKFNKEIKDWEFQQLQQDLNALQLSEYEEKYQRSKATDLEKLNKYLALETKERQRQEKINDDIEKKKDIENTFYSNFMTENPSVARSAYGPHRVVPDRWKGMSQEQLREFYDGQIKQIIERKRKTEQENFELSQWHSEIERQDSVFKSLDEENRKNVSKMNKDLNQDNKHLEQEQKCQQKYMKEVVYTNVPTQEFFNQFNTSSR